MIKLEGGGRFTAAAVSQGLLSGGSLAVTIVLTRMLGLEGFGVVALVLLGAGFAAGLVQALAVQPFLSLGPRATRPGRAAALVLIAAGISVSAGLVAAVVTPQLVGVSPFCAFFAVLARAAAPAFRALAFGRGRLLGALVVDASGGFGALAAVWIIASFTGWTIEAALCGLTVGGLVGALVTARGTELAPGRRRLTASLARSWRDGRWLALTQGFSWLGTGRVHIAAAGLLGPAAVGALRAAQALIGALGVALQALELYLPHGARIARRRGEIGTWTVRWSLWSSGAMLVMSSALWAFGVPLARLLAASEKDAQLTLDALVVLALLPAIGAITGVVSVALRAVGATRTIAACYTVTALLSAAIAGPLVSNFGLFGAASGLVLGQLFYAALLCASSRSSLGPSTVQKLVCVTTGHMGA